MRLFEKKNTFAQHLLPLQKTLKASYARTCFLILSGKEQTEVRVRRSHIAIPVGHHAFHTVPQVLLYTTTLNKPIIAVVVLSHTDCAAVEQSQCALTVCTYYAAKQLIAFRCVC